MAWYSVNVLAKCSFHTFLSEVKWRVAKYGDPYVEFVLCI